jgi:hypothetical protein
MVVEQIIEANSFLSPLILPLVAVIVTLVTIHFWQQTRRERKFGDLIPGPPTLPILGNAHCFTKLKNDGKFDSNLDHSVEI